MTAKEPPSGCWEPAGKRLALGTDRPWQETGLAKTVRFRDAHCRQTYELRPQPRRYADPPLRRVLLFRVQVSRPRGNGAGCAADSAHSMKPRRDASAIARHRPNRQIWPYTLWRMPCGSHTNSVESKYRSP